jgi:hypothetical protein
LVRLVEEDTRLRYVATWKQDKRRWWSADLVVATD